jgi:hypothetical protein
MGFGAGGAGGMSDSVRMFSELQLRRWLRYGCGESVRLSCWLHLVSRRPFYEKSHKKPRLANKKKEAEKIHLGRVSRHFTRRLKEFFNFWLCRRWWDWRHVVELWHG